MDMVCAPLAFIDGLGGPEMVLVFVIVLLLFGGQKLPEFARGLGKTMREFKKAASGVEEEFRRALEDDERKKTTAVTPYTATPALPAATATDPHHYDSDAHAYEHQEDHYSEGGPHAPALDAPIASADTVSSQPAADGTAVSPPPQPAVISEASVVPPVSPPAAAVPVDQKPPESADEKKKPVDPAPHPTP